MKCPPSVLSGEENIANDESPHKCHSINTYHISTFFNQETQKKFLNFINLQNGSNKSTFNYDYLRTYPKMNFDMPE